MERHQQQEDGGYRYEQPLHLSPMRGVPRLMGEAHSAAFASDTFPERCSQGFCASSRLCAVLTSAIWEKACGKFPNSRFAAGSYSSESRPRSLRNDRSRSNKDRKSTRLNSSHTVISYAVFCL